MATHKPYNEKAQQDLSRFILELSQSLHTGNITRDDLTRPLNPPQPDSGPAMTMDKLQEAIALVNALKPQSTPPESNMMALTSGLRIMLNTQLPPGTVMVSQDLYDQIWSASKSQKPTNIAGFDHTAV